MKVEFIRFKRPQVQYVAIRRRHFFWAAVFLFNGWQVALPIAQSRQTYLGATIGYIYVVINYLIAARLVCVQPWFRWSRSDAA